MIIGLKDRKKAVPVFGDWQESLIWSCLQGIMGDIYVKDEEKPVSAMAMLGDFCYLAGEPDEELAAFKPASCDRDFMIMVPENEAWAEVIEKCYGEKAKRVTRYMLKKEKGVFDKKKLETAVSALPADYRLQMIDEALFSRCKELDWCRDFTRQYPDYELFCRHGLGVVVLDAEGEILSGASSYSGFLEGIEVEIDTREDHRRKGLAYICGAKLILECLKRDWYPSWDAQNKWSQALAEKLGYHFSHEYPVYEIRGY